MRCKLQVEVCSRSNAETGCVWRRVRIVECEVVAGSVFVSSLEYELCVDLIFVLVLFAPGDQRALIALKTDRGGAAACARLCKEAAPRLDCETCVRFSNGLHKACAVPGVLHNSSKVHGSLPNVTTPYRRILKPKRPQPITVRRSSISLGRLYIRGAFLHCTPPPNA